MNQGFTRWSLIAIIRVSASNQALKERGDHMPSISDIVKDSVVEFSRLQDWMISSREHGDTDTYNMMYKRYVELRVILSTAGVNITELDKIKG